MTKSLRLLLLALLGVVTGIAEPAQVIVIRHAEKPADHHALHLSAAGRKRSRQLVQYFNSSTNSDRFNRPTVLVATKETKSGGGQRTRETLEPLARELKIAIETPFKSDDFERLAHLVRSQPEYDGKTVLICWTHEYIPELIQAFGVHPKPQKLDENVYDRVFVIDFKDGRTQLRMLQQDLANPAPKDREHFHHPKKLHLF